MTQQQENRGTHAGNSYFVHAAIMSNLNCSLFHSSTNRSLFFKLLALYVREIQILCQQKSDFVFVVVITLLVVLINELGFKIVY